MKPLHLSHFTATSCIGQGLSQTLEALQQRRSGLVHCNFDTVDLDTWIGAVQGVDEISLPVGMKDYDCRNNRLLELAMAQDDFLQKVDALITRYGRNRIGLFLGTSTSGIFETELAYRMRENGSGPLPSGFTYRNTHSTFSAADYARVRLGLTGPAAVVSSACSSSAKVFGSARRMIEAGFIDAAIVGGVDSLCLTTLYGFTSLGLTADKPCRPFDANRNGISIGEGAALIVLERTPNDLDGDAILVAGIGESSDAYHMSSPHPEGLGAKLAMEQALAAAGMQPEQIAYINLHGTATPSNDAAEGKAVAALFGNAIPCSSTKGATGHTLGAAGGIEAVICALALQNGLMPGGVNTETLDPQLPLQYLTANCSADMNAVLSNSFGFGGTNCSLVLKRAN
ncbi:MAG: 3-oxoacyl-ACP synthase [Paucimonas sp.]|nr:3-oxoacyl-ACP synthase [Paucimonas sp.]